MHPCTFAPLFICTHIHLHPYIWVKKNKIPDYKNSSNFLNFYATFIKFSMWVDIILGMLFWQNSVFNLIYSLVYWQSHPRRFFWKYLIKLIIFHLVYVFFVYHRFLGVYSPWIHGYFTDIMQILLSRIVHSIFVGDHVINY